MICFQKKEFYEVLNVTLNPCDIILCVISNSVTLKPSEKIFKCNTKLPLFISVLF